MSSCDSASLHGAPDLILHLKLFWLSGCFSILAFPIGHGILLLRHISAFACCFFFPLNFRFLTLQALKCTGEPIPTLVHIRASHRGQLGFLAER